MYYEYLLITNLTPLKITELPIIYCMSYTPTRDIKTRNYITVEFWDKIFNYRNIGW